MSLYPQEFNVKKEEKSTMDINRPVDDIFSAKGLVVVITGGGSGTNPSIYIHS